MKQILCKLTEILKFIESKGLAMWLRVPQQQQFNLCFYKFHFLATVSYVITPSVRQRLTG